MGKREGVDGRKERKKTHSPDLTSNLVRDSDI